MDESYESTYHELEASNWWFQGRRDIIARLLRKEPRSSEMLDIGCSGGIMIQSLTAVGFKCLSGIDTSEKAILLSRNRGIKNVSVMDGTAPTFYDCKFDTIIASDVLEHIKGAHPALAQWYRILKPGGKLVIFVPAFSFLWSDHDVTNHHFRRYSRPELISELLSAGFIVERASYWNFTLFFPAILNRLSHRLLGMGAAHDNLRKMEPIPNSLLSYLLRFENIFLSFMDFPFGISVFAIAKKPK